MEVKRKRSIEILGVKHKIKHVDTGDKGGFYSAADKEIEIDREVKNQTQYLETLLHESLHGVLYISGIHEDITLVQEHCIIDPIVTFLMSTFNLEFKK